jgi:hypothetical protein
MNLALDKNALVRRSGVFGNAYSDFWRASAGVTLRF